MLWTRNTKLTKHIDQNTPMVLEYSVLVKRNSMMDSLYVTLLEWKRPESHVLTQQLAAQGQKHRQTLTSAQKADLIVRNKLDTWANIIDVLTLTREELEDSIPTDDVSITPTADHPQLRQEDSLVRIKRLVEDMNQHMRIRKDLIDQAKKASNADDISPALLKKAAELTAKSPIVKIEAAQFEELFVDELRKYDDFLMTVDQEDEQQNTILRQLNESYHQYKAKVNDKSSGAKREKALQNLNQAYLKYKEIKTNLSEGLKVVYMYLAQRHRPFSQLKLSFV